MSFDIKLFSERLVSEVLFYDEEYGAIGNLSLINTDQEKEKYIAFYSPAERAFVIEEATEWEDDVDNDDESYVGYHFATDSKTYLSSLDLEEITKTLMRLATDESLYPSISLSFEDDEVV